jgi:hypothetical protein
MSATYQLLLNNYAYAAGSEKPALTAALALLCTRVCLRGRKWAAARSALNGSGYDSAQSTD